jgi:hypothetical protein
MQSQGATSGESDGVQRLSLKAKMTRLIKSTSTKTPTTGQITPAMGGTRQGTTLPAV